MAELLHLTRIMTSQSGYESYDSGVTGDVNIMTISGGTRSQNILFTDQIDPHMYEVESYTDVTRTLQDSSDATLENFFRRPLKIAQEEWGASTTLSFQVNPWRAYFENPRVLERIRNFNLLRCKMHIKIVLNGNGFQYGRLMASYLPLYEFDDFSSNAGLVREDLVQASQWPHLYLDPCTSQGGEMVLPFFYHNNYIHVAQNRFEDLGELFVRTLNPLRNANGGDNISTVTVFAWVEDVHMSVLTSVEPQSGKEVDEANQKGVISGPATAIAKVASALVNVPTIGPYARATATAATATASVAKTFGYSRPPVTKDPEPFKPMVTSSLALTTVPDGANKMTVDDKQELSIDPRIAGIGPTDQLNIREIAKRESYLTTFDWNVGTATETLLWNVRIDPVVWAESGILGAKAFHFPACAVAALPFKFWTGTMRYRFQVVCSAFHKGRLKIVYDPNWLGRNEYNTTYTQIVDIADKTDFTVEIANGQPRSLLNNPKPGITSVTEMYSSTAYTVPESFGNGVLGVYVVNQLTVPNSAETADIEVNVFVSAGQDFEVFVPDDHFQYFTFRPQSGMESKAMVSESQNTAEPSAPQHDVATTLGPTCADNSKLNHVYTGEAIVSFRSMLRRYNLWTAIGNEDPNPKLLSGRFPGFPYWRGRVAGAVSTTSGGNPYNYCNTVLLHWVANAFSGWRGGIRYKIIPKGKLDVDFRPTYYISRAPAGELPYEYNNTVPAAATSFKGAGIGTMVTGGVLPGTFSSPSGTRGTVVQSGYVNTPIEFEIPFYSRSRFVPGKQENWTEFPIYTESWDYRITSKGDETTIYEIHVAAAEDFQAYFYTGLPRCYYEEDPDF